MTTRNTNTLVSIEQFANELGKMNAVFRTNAIPFHNAYTKGTAEQQRDLRVRWMVSHMAGSLDVTVARAEAIREAGKGGNATVAHKAAIDRAYSDFRYYVVRPAPKAIAERDSVVIPAAVLAHLKAIDELVATYPEMRAMCSAYIANAAK
jgi:hypothetical protein